MGSLFWKDNSSGWVGGRGGGASGLHKIARRAPGRLSRPSAAPAWPGARRRGAGGVRTAGAPPLASVRRSPTPPPSRLLNAARSYRRNWKNTGRPPHPRARRGRARPCSCGWGLLLGRRWGPGRGSAGGGLPVSGSGRGLVCQRLPPPRPPAGPPGLPASRRRRARSPRGLAGCRLHRRGVRAVLTTSQVA